MKVAVATKVGMVTPLNNQMLNDICTKLNNAVGRADASSMSRVFHDPSTTIEALEQIQQGLKNNPNNHDNKVRCLVKILFKEEFKTLANLETAVKTLTKYKEGALDLCVKHAIYAQYLGQNGICDWDQMEKEVDKLLKDRIYDQGRNDGYDDAQDQMRDA